MGMKNHGPRKAINGSSGLVHINPKEKDIMNKWVTIEGMWTDH
jgi:hypothetical protein